LLIPVFVSTPNALSAEQDKAHRFLLGELGQLGFEARTLGRTDYPTSFPLREVLTLAKHCSGGVVLGFSQFEATAGVAKKGTPYKRTIKKGMSECFPTAWNHLEAGILFALDVPLLVFREHGISGGVFDNGVTDLFVHPMPKIDVEYTDKKALRAVFHKWSAQVRAHYYGER
jgi:hypothetical protein